MRWYKSFVNFKFRASLISMLSPYLLGFQDTNTQSYQMIYIYISNLFNCIIYNTSYIKASNLLVSSYSMHTLAFLICMLRRNLVTRSYCYIFFTACLVKSRSSLFQMTIFKTSFFFLNKMRYWLHYSTKQDE